MSQMNREAPRITILGAGTWGIALARVLSLNGHRVTVWSKFPEEAEQLPFHLFFRASGPDEFANLTKGLVRA